jgi:hypothetical protein
VLFPLACLAFVLHSTFIPTANPPETERSES